jgi:sortase A
MATAGPPPLPSFLPGSATTKPHSFAALLGLAMRRPGGRRSLSALITVLVLGAVSMFAYPAVTDLIGGQKQLHVAQEFANPHFKTVYRDGHVEVGQGLTRLLINNPRVKVNVLVVEGTTVAALRAGAGHYVGTPYPCWKAGNVGIAGHRTTFGRPFNRINYMQPGDTVTLITPVARCVYQVMAPPVENHSANPFVVSPTDQAVVYQTNTEAKAAGQHLLTLTSCNPPGSAAQRIVLRLSMISCNGSTCQKGST